MQMVKKVSLIFLGVWLALLLFMPKAELYYTLEKKLETKDIRLNEKSIDEGLFSLSVTEVTVYVKGIALAKIEELNFFTLLFYNSVSIDNLIVDEALHAKVPALTQQAHIVHSILTPLTLTVDANGSFGKIVGDIDVQERKIHIDFVETKDISMIQSSLTKSEKGWIYEKSF
jgi:uncharacterized membrane protein